MSFRFFPFYAMLMKTNITEGKIAMSENTKTCRKLPFYYHYDTPIGLVRIEETGDALTGLYLYQKHSFPLEEHTQYYRETVLIAEAHRQLLDYFKGQRKIFQLPLRPEGTPFQQKVWDALCQIPYGQTKSYSEIAALCGNPKACRAVGGACHNNPLLILIPCHRVLGKNGSLTGFGGGLSVKEYLLRLEKEKTL